MSKPIQFLQPGYYPILPPPLPALQLSPNPVQRYVHVWEQFYTPASILPTNPQFLTPVPVQIATQVAHNAFWNFPFPMLPPHHVPAAHTLNVPVLPEPPAVSAPAAQPAPEVAQPMPVRRKRPYLPPEKFTFIEAREQLLLPTANISVPRAPVNGTALIRTLMHDGTTLLKQRRYLEGILCFRQAVLMDHFIFHFLPACHEVLKEIRPEILRYVGDVLSRNPKDINALFLKGLCYIGPGKYGIALNCFVSILRTNPKDLLAKALYSEVSKMCKRDIQPPEEEDEVQQASVKRKMAISALLVDEDTSEEVQHLPKAVIKKNT
jgi:tetratricopeptide (TPR) repeat protein